MRKSICTDLKIYLYGPPPFLTNHIAYIPRVSKSPCTSHSLPDSVFHNA